MTGPADVSPSATGPPRLARGATRAHRLHCTAPRGMGRSGAAGQIYALVLAAVVIGGPLMWALTDALATHRELGSALVGAPSAGTLGLSETGVGLGLLLLAPAALGAVVGCAFGLPLPRAFELRMVFDSPRPRGGFVRSRVWPWVLGAACVGAAVGCACWAAGWPGAAAWVPCTAAAGTAAPAGAAVCAVARPRVSTVVAVSLGVGVTAGLALLTERVGAVGTSPATEPANAHAALVLGTIAGVLCAIQAAAIMLPVRLLRVDEAAACQRVLRRTAAAVGLAVGDAGAARAALGETPRPPDPSPLFGTAPTREGKRSGRLVPAGFWHLVGTHLVSARRRPIACALGMLAAAGAIGCLLLTPVVGEGLLWLPLGGFAFLASGAQRAFDAAMVQAAHSGTESLFGIPPGWQLAAALFVPVLIAVTTVGLSSVAALVLDREGIGPWAVPPGSPAVANPVRAGLLIAPLCALRLRGLLAPPLPPSLVEPIPTAIGDIAGVRVLVWMLQDPLLLVVFALAVSAAWPSSTGLTVLSLVALLYASLTCRRRVRSA